MEFSWSETDTNTTWFVYLTNASSSYTDTIITNNPNCIFDSLLSGEPYHIEISSTQALGTNCKLKQHWIHTLCACPKANNIIITEIQPNEATLEWDRDTNATGWIVQYKMRDYPNDSLLTIITYTNSITLEDLIPVRPYIVIVNSYCDSLRSHCSNTFEFFTSIFTIECITFTDLKDLNFIPTFGNYEDPYSHNGLIDYGYNSSQSRHTVHYDTTERDARTNYLLPTIPPGELASVRLGNWLQGAQAESCTYAYMVDSNSYDMFILNYAIVLEDPNHIKTEQPRFTLEILDSNYLLIDEECGYTDFYASGDLGWDSVENTNTIWKNWTSIGIDISQYHDQVIYVRLTTKDCGEGGHFGYAYYTIKCAKRYINKNICGHIDSLIFEAPQGFDYSWYNINNIEDTISTNNHINVSVDNNNYICKCSYKENNNCYFLLSFEAERRFPYALFDFSPDSCGYKFQFFNKSIVSNSETTPIGVETCKDIKWIFHDSTVSYMQNPTFKYDSSGVYRVILIARLNNGLCVDTIIKDIVVDNSTFRKIHFIGDTIVCYGNQTEIQINDLDKCKWSTGDTTNTIIVSPTETSTYHIMALDNNCARFDSIKIYVFPNYNNDTIEAVICKRDSFNLHGFNLSDSGYFSRKAYSIYGCDSIINLHLIVNPIYIDTILAEICKGDNYIDFGFNEEAEGFYTHFLTTEDGCDSIVNLSLKINPIFNDTINAAICFDDYYDNNNFRENKEGLYTNNYQTINGCDSIVNLNLKVGERIENYSIIKEKHRIVEEFPIIVDVSCEHCFYYRWNTGSNDSVLIINNYGNYYITINHICGHIYDSIIIFRPEVNIFTPNAFTPSELNNNSFFPVYEDNNTVFIERFDIYNRWDELLYSSTYKPWDGTFNNNNCPTGVYAWRLLYRTKYTGNQIFEKAGQVSLIR